MSGAPLADRLRAGDVLYCAWVTTPGPYVAEAVAGLAFDGVAFDVQHGAHDIASLILSITAVVTAGKAALVRTALGDYAGAARALDFGADVIIAPMIASAAEARALVAATKYPPVGERSWGPDRARMLHGTTRDQHLAEGNLRSVVLAMIETRQAVAALDEILAVEGLDGVFVGPSDLSVALSDGGRIAPTDPSLDDALTLVASRAASAGKIAGIFSLTADRVPHFRSLGFRLIALGSDQLYLQRGALDMLAEAKASRGG